MKISESLPVQSMINVSTQMETTIGHQANYKLRKHRASIAPQRYLQSPHGQKIHSTKTNSSFKRQPTNRKPTIVHRENELPTVPRLSINYETIPNSGQTINLSHSEKQYFLMF